MTTLTYSGATGAFLAEKPLLGTRPSIGESAFALMGPLHFGNFAGWWSKAVWFALGAASAYVTWTGLLLWIRRRDTQPLWRAFARLTVWSARVCRCDGGFGHRVLRELMLPSRDDVVLDACSVLHSAVLALVPACIIGTDRVAPVLFCATGVALLTLPALRITTGGPSWSAALGAGRLAILPVLDVLVIIGAAVCFLSALPFIRRRDAATTALVSTAGRMSVTSLGFIATAFTTACLVAVAASENSRRAAGKRSSSRKLRPLAAIAGLFCQELYSCSWAPA